MVSVLAEATDLIRSIRHRIDVLNSAAVILPDDPAVIDYMSFNVPDVWQDVKSPAGVYWGRMKRVSNGSPDYLVTMTEYMEPMVMESEWHYHVHIEAFQVLDGFIEVTMKGVDHLRVNPGGWFRVPAYVPHQVNVHPNTKMVLTWIRQK